MSYLGQNTLQGSPTADLNEREWRLGAPDLVRKDVASNGEAWLPLLMVFGAIGAVAYADHRVTSVSLAYLYILPLAVGAIFMRREISYSPDCHLRLVARLLLPAKYQSANSALS